MLVRLSVTIADAQGVRASVIITGLGDWTGNCIGRPHLR